MKGERTLATTELDDEDLDNGGLDHAELDNEGREDLGDDGRHVALLGLLELVAETLRYLVLGHRHRHLIRELDNESHQ